jgi:hypothetical protein
MLIRKSCKKKEVLQFFKDKKYLYVLYDDSFVIYNKKFLTKSKTKFPVKEYTEKVNAYHKFIDSLNLKNLKSFAEYKRKSKVLESKFKSFIGEYHLFEHQDLTENIWNSNGFDIELYHEILDNQIEYQVLKLNFNSLSHALCLNGNFHEVNRLDSLIEKEYPDIKKEQNLNYSYLSSISSIKKYFQNLDSLEQNISDVDSLKFLKILEMKRICSSSWFCSEGCGGCNFQLVLDELEDFKTTNTNEYLLDDIEYELLQIKYQYEEEQNGIAKAYELFIARFPESSRILEVSTSLLSIYSYDDYNAIKDKKEKGTKLLQKIKHQFPEYSKTKEFKNYERRIKSY